MKRGWKRTLLAQMRDLRVLFVEFRGPLLLFIGVITGGALVLRLFYSFPVAGGRPSFAEALYACFALMFLESVLPFPNVWYLQVLFFAIPVLGLGAAADGVIRFGSALLDKRQRGQKWEIAMASTYSDHVIVCGLGKVGFRVALELVKFGKEVVGVEMDEHTRFTEKARSLDIPIIVGDARRSANLIKAGVERAAAIIPCTNDELANLDIALDARDIRPEIKVVMRMFDADLARRVEKGFGIHTAFSTSALAAPVFAVAATGLNVTHSFYLDDTLLALGEIVVAAGSPLVGRSVQSLESDMDVSVVYYQGDNVTDLRPEPDQHLAPGDRILALAKLDTLETLTDLNSGTGA